MSKSSLSFLLAILAIASAAVSCGEAAADPGNDTEPAVTETETQVKEPSPYELMGDRDFGGRTFTVFDGNYSNGLQVNFPEDTLTGEVVNDSLFNRDITIENRYNVDIEYVQSTDLNKMDNSVMANEAAYDLAYSTLGRMATSQTKGYLFNMNDMPDMRLDEQWWSPLMAQALTLKDAIYLTAGDICPSVYQAACCMFLNLQLYDNYDIEEDIYQLVLDGKWTLDALERLTRGMDVDVNGDGSWDNDNDIYGIGMQPTSETARAFLDAAGVVLSKASDDGNNIIFCSADNERMINTAEKVKKVARNIPYQDINDVINKTFKSDRALFLQHKLETAAVHLRDMKSDYLILPDPKFDESQDHYISFLSKYCSSFVGVPATADPDFDGFITEAMARYSHEFIRPKAFEMVYKEKTVRDPRSIEVLDILFDNLYIDFAETFDLGSVNAVFTDAIFKDKPLASALEAKLPSIETAIEKLVNSWVIE